MNRILKIALTLIAALAGIVVIAAVALLLFFDPNDFKAEISAAARDATGRELVIDGDLSVSFFPWIAIEMGRTQMGNAEGFGEQPFLVFDSAELSVRLMPLLFEQQAKIGTASLHGLVVNLELDGSGRNNWDDLSEPHDSDADASVESSGSPTEFDISGVDVTDATVSYRDAAAGSAYTLSNMHFSTGAIAAGEPIDFNSEFDFEALPDAFGGHVAIRGTATSSSDLAQFTFDNMNAAGEVTGIAPAAAEFNLDARQINVDTVAESAAPGEMDFSILGVSVSANVEPFSYAGTPQPKADLRVAEFSLKELMQALDIEAPVTANPDALGKVSFEARADLSERNMALSGLVMQLDDSTMTGSLSLPLADNEKLRFDLAVDAIIVDDYMEPADDGLAADNAGDESDIEIPVDMIRSLQAEGQFRMQRALFSGLEFTNLKVGLNNADGKLRLNPLSADLYEGSYQGDVRIDASRDIPALSVNEQINGVDLASLVKTLYDQDNITGHINGSFVLSGSGRSVAAIRQDLDGNVAFELVDGAYEGTDVWYQIRLARAKFRQETPPEPTLPPRTRFTAVKATGVVTDGILANDDLLVELPTLQLAGKGMVDLNTTELDYSMQARVLKKPELMSGVSAAELDDLTKVVIPLKVTGTVASPRIAPDFQALVQQRVEEEIDKQKEELKKKLFDRLLGGDDEASSGEPGSADTDQEQNAEEAAEESPEEALKKKLLKDLFGN